LKGINPCTAEAGHQHAPRPRTAFSLSKGCYGLDGLHGVFEEAALEELDVGQYLAEHDEKPYLRVGATKEEAERCTRGAVKEKQSRACDTAAWFMR